MNIRIARPPHISTVVSTPAPPIALRPGYGPNHAREPLRSRSIDPDSPIGQASSSEWSRPKASKEACPSHRIWSCSNLPIPWHARRSAVTGRGAAFRRTRKVPRLHQPGHVLARQRKHA